jgi:hypothetical protein
MNNTKTGAYSADDDIVDFILGITFEIWEQGGVELIHQYYAADSIVWGPVTELMVTTRRIGC